jgi:hypothetical protein
MTLKEEMVWAAAFIAARDGKLLSPMMLLDSAQRASEAVSDLRRAFELASTNDKLRDTSLTPAAYEHLRQMTFKAK